MSSIPGSRDIRGSRRGLLPRHKSLLSGHHLPPPPHHSSAKQNQLVECVRPMLHGQKRAMSRTPQLPPWLVFDLYKSPTKLEIQPRDQSTICQRTTIRRDICTQGKKLPPTNSTYHHYCQKWKSCLGRRGPEFYKFWSHAAFPMFGKPYIRTYLHFKKWLPPGL